ncbi:4-hydroxymandelate synthase [Streptomyces sp. enrichment culture]|uniref:4-hydroxyphenylpyruvate dioxygenase n=1 Tax=Streptomyces sp. enrichment culture TaxID=1795815 RepID=UPI003F54A901
MQYAHRATLHHVEFYVSDAEARAAEMVEVYGFRVCGRNVADDHRSVAVRQGDITFVYTQALTPEHAAHAYTDTHGDAPAVIWLACDDARAAFQEAVAAGAGALQEPVEDSVSGCVTATIRAFGNVRHTFLQWLPVADRKHIAPGIIASAQDRPHEGVGLLAVDHFAVCVPTGHLDATIAYYEQALGFRKIFEEQIIVGRQSMLSQVVQNAAGDVTLTIIEPDTTREPGQIDKFIRDHGGAGVQHIAFSCRDVVDSVRTLRAAGVVFLSSPDTYYENLPKRLSLRKYDVAELRDLGLLADSDHAGQLFQIFTRSTHPRGTFFLELIERLGAETFGSGNIKALYEAVEQDMTAPASGGGGTVREH